MPASTSATENLQQSRVKINEIILKFAYSAQKNEHHLFSDLIIYY